MQVGGEMMAEDKTIRHTHESDTPYKVHLYRGPSAKYNWEITVGSKSTEEAITKVKELDAKLTKEYGNVGDKAPKKGGLN
jgi:hypothetical protein